MSKALDMENIQKSIFNPEQQSPDKAKPTTVSLPAFGSDGFWDHARYVGNIILNGLLILFVACLISVISIVGDRVYLSYTNTGSSKFENFLRRQGYGEQALAYKDLQKACLDSNNTLALCKGAAWLYLHPEIPVWPNNHQPAPTLAEVPRREP